MDMKKNFILIKNRRDFSDLIKNVWLVGDINFMLKYSFLVNGLCAREAQFRFFQGFNEVLMEVLMK